MCWSVLWLGQLQDLGYTVKLIDGGKRGGELVSLIAPFTYCANPYLKQMATNMIKKVINSRIYKTIICVKCMNVFKFV